MKNAWIWLVLLAAGAALGGCIDYGAGSGDKEDECRTIAECNPGRTSVDLIPSVDGRVYGEGELVQLDPPDYGACGQDSDCVLVFSDGMCCGGGGLGDYQSLVLDRLDAWREATGCADVICEDCGYCPFEVPEVCWGGECIEAFCQQAEDGGRCDMRPVDPFACSTDDECVKTDVDCCGCEGGGVEAAVHRDLADAWGVDLEYLCSFDSGLACLGVWLCTGRPAICEQGRCAVAADGCGCPHLYDPVCAWMDYERMETLPNECQANCEEAPWWHAGECQEGEGQGCGGIVGLACFEEQLYCTCPGCDCSNPFGGLCLPVGICVIAEDCYWMEHPQCEGDWSCEWDTCVWTCD